MNRESRTYKSLVNSGVALLFYVVTFFLSFIAKRILLAQLGPDLLGLNTTTGSLLFFLNLAELGIGTAIAFTLYKPLQTTDIQTINEIVSLQGWFYKRVAGFSAQNRFASEQEWEAVLRQKLPKRILLDYGRLNSGDLYGTSDFERLFWEIGRRRWRTPVYKLVRGFLKVMSVFVPSARFVKDIKG